MRNHAVADYPRISDSFVNGVRNTNGGLIINGDFNVRMIDWRNHHRGYSVITNCRFSVIFHSI